MLPQCNEIWHVEHMNNCEYIFQHTLHRNITRLAILTRTTTEKSFKKYERGGEVSGKEPENFIW